MRMLWAIYFASMAVAFLADGMLSVAGFCGGIAVCVVGLWKAMSDFEKLFR